MKRSLKPSILPTIFLIFFLSYPISAQQAAGNRIISLTPSNTEILFALALEDEIVGVSSYCDWPAEAKKKEKVGSFSNPNIEKIISLKPDLVLLAGIEQGHLKNILSNLNIKFLVTQPANLKELISSIEEIADLTDREKQGRALVDKIKKAMRGLDRMVSKIPVGARPKVYIEFWHDPIMTIGGNSFINDLIETAGGINIARDLKRSYSKIDPEAVIFRDPNIIILTYHAQGKNWIKENFAKRIGWRDIDAIKNKRIIQDINPNIILRPGPRVAEGLIELHKRFYED